MADNMCYSTTCVIAQHERQFMFTRNKEERHEIKSTRKYIVQYILSDAEANINNCVNKS